MGQLISWCHGRRRLLLVYELVSNGSLDGHLYSTEVTLTWPTRYAHVAILWSDSYLVLAALLLFSLPIGDYKSETWPMQSAVWVHVAIR